MTRRSMPSSFHVNLFALVGPLAVGTKTCDIAMIQTLLKDSPVGGSCYLFD